MAGPFCACGLRELPRIRKRDLSIVFGDGQFERHNRGWCAELIRGEQQIDGWTIHPTPVTFIRLDAPNR